MADSSVIHNLEEAIKNTKSNIVLTVLKEQLQKEQMSVPTKKEVVQVTARKLVVIVDDDELNESSVPTNNINSSVLPEIVKRKRGRSRQKKVDTKKRVKRTYKKRTKKVHVAPKSRSQRKPWISRIEDECKQFLIDHPESDRAPILLDAKVALVYMYEQEGVTSNAMVSIGTDSLYIEEWINCILKKHNLPPINELVQELAHAVYVGHVQAMDTEDYSALAKCSYAPVHGREDEDEDEEDIGLMQDQPIFVQGNCDERHHEQQVAVLEHEGHSIQHTGQKDDQIAPIVEEAAVLEPEEHSLQHTGQKDNQPVSIVEEDEGVHEPVLPEDNQPVSIVEEDEDVHEPVLPEDNRIINSSGIGEISENLVEMIAQKVAQSIQPLITEQITRATQEIVKAMKQHHGVSWAPSVPIINMPSVDPSVLLKQKAQECFAPLSSTEHRLYVL